MGKKGDFRVYINAFNDEVDGTKFLLHEMRPDGRDYTIAVDFGGCQSKKYEHLNYENEINPNSINAILLTHPHYDHYGMIPKIVHDGYRNSIYMTTISLDLIPKFFHNACELQEEAVKAIKKRYPEDAWKFDILYYKEDVENTLKLCKGVKFNRRFEVIPESGIYATFFDNGHLLGAGMILIEFTYEKRKPLNFLFTGDYKLNNIFFKVHQLPKHVRNMELILVHEATYGTTLSQDIKICFEKNLQDAINKNQNILIGAFAQGRMQEILYRLKLLDDAGQIPKNYRIMIDGPLGISTTIHYIKILSWYNPSMMNFIPRVPDEYYETDDIKRKEAILIDKLQEMIVNPKSRDSILLNDNPVILITTSGMLSNGPAKTYVPMFIEHNNAMIHITGYAAEGTVARALLDTKHKDTVVLGENKVIKKATIKSTREMSGHPTLDEMIEFIEQFKNIRFFIANHGEHEVKGTFANYVSDSCDNVVEANVIDRQTMYCIYQFGKRGEKFSNIDIHTMPSNLSNHLPITTSNKKIKKKKINKRKKKSRNLNKKQTKKH